MGAKSVRVVGLMGLVAFAGCGRAAPAPAWLGGPNGAGAAAAAAGPKPDPKPKAKTPSAPVSPPGPKLNAAVAGGATLFYPVGGPPAATMTGGGGSFTWQGWTWDGGTGLTAPGGRKLAFCYTVQRNGDGIWQWVDGGEAYVITYP